MSISRPLAINIALGTVVVAALAAGIIVLHPLGTPTAAADADTVQLTGTVQKGVVSSTITAGGSLAPGREVTSSFAVSGTLTSVAIEVGSTVTVGQTLGTIDSSQLQKAKTSAATALSSATLTAPIAGVVVAVNGSVGETTQAGSRAESVTPSGTTSSGTGGSTGAAASGFVTIADASTLTMTANIAEADIPKVTVGQDATVHFPALGTETAPAKVTAIAPTATTSNSVVTYATTIALTSAPTGLRLGQTAQVSITTRTSKTAALYVPTAAITTADGVSTVKVVASDGTTTAKTVTLGIAGDVGTVITKGLSLGEKVVIGSVSASRSSPENTPGRSRFGGGAGGFGGRQPGEFGGTLPGGGRVPGGNN